MATNKKGASAKSASQAAAIGNEAYFADFDFARLDHSLEAMLRAGVHFGHVKARRHPRMADYIYTTRNGINIFDLERTAARLKEAADFLVGVRKGGKQVLFVATKKQSRDLTKSLAKRLGMPYVVERWLGGTFTNFPVIRGRAKYLKDTQEKLDRGEFQMYTKFERQKISEELEKLEHTVGGIKDMTDLPGAVFISDVKDSSIVVREARKAGIPIVGIVDTNADPSDIDYVIPANDDAVSSLRYLLGCVGQALDGVVPEKPAEPTAPKSGHRAE